MIALLSQNIEAGARAFANLLLTIFPFLPASLETNPEQIMIVVGFAGQGLFRYAPSITPIPLMPAGVLAWSL